MCTLCFKLICFHCSFKPPDCLGGSWSRGFIPLPPPPGYAFDFVLLIAARRRSSEIAFSRSRTFADDGRTSPQKNESFAGTQTTELPSTGTLVSRPEPLDRLLYTTVVSSVNATSRTEPNASVPVFFSCSRSYPVCLCLLGRSYQSPFPVVSVVSIGLSLKVRSQEYKIVTQSVADICLFV